MASYFEDARDFKIDHFVSSSVVYSGSKSPLERLQENVAVGAMHTSSQRSNAPKCYPGSRAALQERILGWICSGDGPKILWLKGGSGTGKTAIAGSIADQCMEKRYLSGGFFFSSSFGTIDKRSKLCIVATLVYQLRHHEALRHRIEPYILSSIEHDPFIFAKSLKVQMEELILRKLQPTALFPKVIIIDGFDECEAEEYQQTTKEEDQLEILHMLLQAAADPAFPFRILVSSRYQPSHFFEEAREATLTLSLDGRDDTDTDIALFLRAKFSEIQRRHRLPVNWPGEAGIQRLVFYASARFGWASIILQTISRGRVLPGGTSQSRTQVRVPREAEQVARLASYMQKQMPGVVMTHEQKSEKKGWVLHTTSKGTLTYQMCLRPQQSNGSWAESVPPEIISELTKTELTRQEAINELIVTEGMYLRDLELLRESWIDRIEKDNTLLYPRGQSVAPAFANFRDIISLTTRFNEALTRRREYHAVVDAIGDIVLEHVQLLEPYMSYGEHFIWAKYELQKKREANPAFAAFARKKIEKSPDSHVYPLEAFLWRPLSRFTRYNLLLRSLLDYTPTECSDRPQVLKSTEILQDVQTRFNECAALSERRFDLTQLAKHITFKPGEEDLRLLDEGRELVLKGSLFMYEHDTELRVYMMLDHAILFTKLAQTMNDERIEVYQRPIPLGLLRVSLASTGGNLNPTDAQSETLNAYSLLKKPFSKVGAATSFQTAHREEKAKYWIRFELLGRCPYSLVLWATTLFLYDSWADKIVKTQRLRSDKNPVLAPVPLTQGFVKPFDQFNCYALFVCYGVQKVVCGTNDGVYLSHHSDADKTIVKVLDILNVTQIDVLEETGLLVLISSGHFVHFPLGALDPGDPNAGLGSANIRVMRASYFTIGQCLGRTLVCVAKASQVSTTFKVFEVFNEPEGASRKVKLNQSADDRLKIFREFYIPMTLTSAHFFSGSMWAGRMSGFEVVDMQTLCTQNFLDAEDPSLEFVRRWKNPHALGLYKITEDEFLVCYDVNAFYVDSKGRRTRKEFKIDWKGQPQAIALRLPYILAFDPSFIEVWDVQSGSMAQIIQGQNMRLLYERARHPVRLDAGCFNVLFASEEGVFGV